jgi:hypothetical protein
MSAPTLDADLVAGLCRAATASGGPAALVSVETDPLDGTVWIRMSSWPRAEEARKALHAYGINAHDTRDCRLHVIGWDARLLHRRLGVALAGVDDLTTEWEATAELVRYHHDRRVDSGEEPEPWNVLADVEAAMRTCIPIPQSAPNIADIEALLQLIDKTEDAYQQLIAEHLDYAERALAEHVAMLQHCGAALTMQ